MGNATTERSPSWLNKKVIGGVLGVVVAILIMMQTPPEGLTPEGLKALAILIWAIIYWVFDVWPDYGVAMAMSSLFVIMKVVPMGTAFSCFSTDSWWILVTAITLGVAAANTGLLARASLYIIKMFPATFRGQAAGLIISGTVLGPAIPSITAKAMIGSPLAHAIGRAMGYENKSRGMNGLFAAAGTGYIWSCPITLSASYICFMVVGLCPKADQAMFTWNFWLGMAAVWGIIMLVGCYFSILGLYNPKEKASVPEGFVEQQIKERGPLSRDEKVTTIVVLLALVGWMTATVHNVPASIVAMVGVVLLVATGVIKKIDFRKDVVWDAIIFIGCIISLGTVFTATKIDVWIGNVTGPILGGVLSSPYLYLIVLAIMVYLLRFLIVSMGACISVLMVLFAPIAHAAGIHPFVTGFTILAACNVWNLFYTNVVWVAAYYAAGDGVIDYGKLQKFSVAYMVVCIAGLLASVPVWKMVGLIS